MWQRPKYADSRGPPVRQGRPAGGGGGGGGASLAAYGTAAAAARAAPDWMYFDTIVSYCPTSAAHLYAETNVCHFSPDEVNHWRRRRRL